MCTILPRRPDWTYDTDSLTNDATLVDFFWVLLG